MDRFIENNKERCAELAKRSGSDREQYLIGLINQITKDRDELIGKIKEVSRQTEVCVSELFKLSKTFEQNNCETI